MANNTLSVYQKNGFDNRQQYLNNLELEYGRIVHDLANILGPDEDFDGLVTELQDMKESGLYD